MGEGFAGAAVLAGRVYVIDYDQKNEADLIRCMSLDDGKDIWNYSYPVKIKRNHGMSRTVPAVTEKYIVTIGPKCQVTCLDSMTGEFKWMLDLVKDYGTTVPEWYAGQCPIIEDDKAIIAPGGKPLMMAVDCNSGDIVWQTPNPNKWGMTHYSIVPADILGKHMYLYCTTGGVVAVSAQDGNLLWEYPDWKIKLANVSCPLVIGDDKVFFSGGYNSGAEMVQLSLQDDKITSKTLFKLDAKTFGAEQQTPILYDNHIWGVRPDKEFVCLDLDGNVTWSSSRTNRFGPQGLGPYAIADGKIYILNDDGTLTLAKASTTGYNQLATSQSTRRPRRLGTNGLRLRPTNHPRHEQNDLPRHFSKIKIHHKEAQETQKNLSADRRRFPDLYYWKPCLVDSNIALSSSSEIKQTAFLTSKGDIILPEYSHSCSISVRNRKFFPSAYAVALSLFVLNLIMNPG